nr:hypothetical protein [Barrientosiimonas endolithica]
MDPIQVRQAERDDALGVAALVLAMDREDGADARPGFLTEYADAWLLDVDRRPTWLAEESDGNPVGLVQTAMVRKLPSLRRPTTAWMHVALVFVRPTHRGEVSPSGCCATRSSGEWRRASSASSSTRSRRLGRCTSGSASPRPVSG